MDDAKRARPHGHSERHPIHDTVESPRCLRSIRTLNFTSSQEKLKSHIIGADVGQARDPCRPRLLPAYWNRNTIGKITTTMHAHTAYTGMYAVCHRSSGAKPSRFPTNLA